MANKLNRTIKAEWNLTLPCMDVDAWTHSSVCVCVCGFAPWGQLHTRLRACSSAGVVGAGWLGPIVMVTRPTGQSAPYHPSEAQLKIIFTPIVSFYLMWIQEWQTTNINHLEDFSQTIENVKIGTQILDYIAYLYMGLLVIFIDIFEPYIFDTTILLF